MLEANTEVATISEAIGIATNNIAEYKALEAAISKAQDMGYTEIHINADSELMIKQLKGEYKVKNQDLKVIFNRIKTMLSSCKSYTLKHVRREQNARADELANLAF